MNVALPALIVFFLLLPGFIFRTNLKRAERTSLDFSPFGQVVAEAILWALALHLFWLYLSHLFFKHDFEPVVLMKLLSSAPAIQADATDAVGRQFNWIAAYFATLIIVAFALPKIIRYVISRYRLDRADAPFSAVFRFHQAPWYYLLTGADFTHEDAPDLIVVSAIVEVGKEAVLYVGALDEFYVDADGQLDRVVLQSVARRPVSADKTSVSETNAADTRFYPVDGDSFVLRYSEAITLNIQYVRLTPEETEPDGSVS
jgi:hypothetical protein